MSISRDDKPTTGRPDPAPEADHRRLRKAAPATDPLPRTLKWVASLPPNVRPVALLRHYARIANVIALTWDDPISCIPYMNSLFIDTRANRQGFPPDVLSELREIRRHYGAVCAKTLSGWDRGKRK